MRKYLLLSCIMIVGMGLYGCGKSNSKPISEVIRKVWTANVVKENTTTVYTKGTTGNIKDSYSFFKLDLSNASQQTVRLTTIDQTTFVGNWTISTDNSKLTLTNLQPVPTGTNGTIEFTFDGIPTETQLNLTRTSPDAKTGNTTNVYQLVNP